MASFYNIEIHEYNRMYNFHIQGATSTCTSVFENNLQVDEVFERCLKDEDYVSPETN